MTSSREIGYRRYPGDVTVPWTQALTVYAYPEELNYEEVRKKEWFNLEVFQRYIVSKGPRHEEFSLAENMWGERYLPQTSILPLVDLVITHGGNNTVTEVFALGKPMIVFPIYSDQFDNAQRLDELGYGVRLHTYSFTEEQLLTAIEKLLGDEQLKSKLAAASERILARDRHQELAMKIEQMFCTESSGV
ncbi:hypothetical protein TYRP_011938 [Tyrophagus putrescentiae]|nr:hypothetical protein TYRP_011938 [Tyrophagus putrescentiae]